jgi:hypothetical protein
MTMAEHEAHKRERLDRLSRQAKLNHILLTGLSAQTRQAQLHKARALTEHNPLNQDETEIYSCAVAKLRQMQLRRFYHPPNA